MTRRLLVTARLLPNHIGYGRNQRRLPTLNRRKQIHTITLDAAAPTAG
ncbi:MAG: hypothetical protein KC449_14825 [Anaerolineales bacterium]|nr:hypothetical protein [Anaerolineales bacterium]